MTTSLVEEVPIPQKIESRHVVVVPYPGLETNLLMVVMSLVRNFKQM
jgi:hypothetical protein